MNTDKCRIVVVDGGTLNPGDVSWSPFHELGHVAIYDASRREEVISRACDADAIIVNKVVLQSAELSQLRRLKYIGLTATGYDNVDVVDARARDIVVTNVPEYGTFSVAQMTFALLLELCHRIGHHSAAVRSGRWSASDSFCFWDFPLVELHGRTIGIVGMGKIGRSVAEIARSFGMRVLGFSPSATGKNLGDVQFSHLDEIFRESDIVTLHCPLNQATKGLVDAKRLKMMKRTAFLLNTSRGGLVVSNDLAQALIQGTIAGAALDVLDIEPPPRDHALSSLPNCIITPHIAWATKAARLRLLQTAAGNLQAFLNGEPTNVVR